MAGTGGSFSAQGGSSLPTPKIRLKHNTSTPADVSVRSVGFGGVGDVDSFNVRRAVDVVAMDVTEQQIEAGLHVEMVVYRNSKSRSAQSTQNPDNSREAGYIIPASVIGGVNPLQAYGGTTRGGLPNNVAVAGDRPNHYKVTQKNEALPVWEYLHNRLVFDNVQYRTTTGNVLAQQVTIPFTNYRSRAYYPGSIFPYSGHYRPYYFAFRYIVWDAFEETFVSGPLTKTLVLSPEVHPFRYNPVASATLGLPSCSVSPGFDPRRLKIQFETRTP